MEINIQDYLIFKNEILNFINLYINEIKQFFINGPKDPYAIFDVFDKEIKYSLNYQDLGYDIIFSKIYEGNYQ